MKRGVGMIDKLNSVIYWVLTYLYESTGFSLLIAFLFMFFYKAVWIYQCAESACPVFWKSPVRKEEIMVSDR